MAKKIKVVPEQTKPFTIENVLAAVARENKFRIEDLEAEEVEPGLILVNQKEHKDQSWYGGISVCTAEAATRINVNYIKEVIATDALLDTNLSAKEIFEVLIELVDVSDLEPWVLARTREYVRELALVETKDFWRLWRKAGLKPSYVEVKKGRSKGDRERNGDQVYPSFDLVKDLQDHEVKKNTKDDGAIFATVERLTSDEREEGAFGVLLDQCHLDSDKMAHQLFEKSGGLLDTSYGSFTKEGFFVLDD